MKIASMFRPLLLLMIIGIASAHAQDPGTLNPEPLPPLANPNSPSIPARELFARKTTPLAGPARSIGTYNGGCLEGGVALPLAGPAWQVMRVSRDRYWGNPTLVAFIERLGEKVKKVGWNGLLIGDMAQPRGGPMLNGHSSHQIGLDVDIWFTPMPIHELSREEVEFEMALKMVAKDRRDVDQTTWTHERTELVRAAALDRPSSEFSSIRLSRRRCVGKRVRTALGSPRCARGGDTTNIFTSASLVRRTVRYARRSRRLGRATGADMNSRAG